MKREFYYNSSFSIYLKNYFKVMSISLILLFVLSGKIYFSEWQNKETIILCIIIGYSLLLFITSMIHYNIQKSIRYVFTDETILKYQKGKEQKYLLTDIEDVSKQSDKRYQKTGIDYIKIKFKNGDKIKFDNTLPYYPSLKTFLKNLLIEKLDYIIRDS